MALAATRLRRPAITALDVSVGAVIVCGLDLFDRAVHLQSALSTPLVEAGEVIGVLTAYAPAGNAFTTDNSRVMEMMAPHLAHVLATALEREHQPHEDADDLPTVTGGTRDLRLVASR